MAVQNSGGYGRSLEEYQLLAYQLDEGWKQFALPRVSFVSAYQNTQKVLQVIRNLGPYDPKQKKSRTGKWDTIWGINEGLVGARSLFTPLYGIEVPVEGVSQVQRNLTYGHIINTLREYVDPSSQVYTMGDLSRAIKDFPLIPKRLRGKVSETLQIYGAWVYGSRGLSPQEVEGLIKRVSLLILALFGDEGEVAGAGHTGTRR